MSDIIPNAVHLPQTDVRHVDARFLATEGYVAALFRPRLIRTSGANHPLGQSTVRFKNLGEEAVELQLNETPEYASGLRTSLASALTIVPGGFGTASISPTEEYVEVIANSGNSLIEATITTVIDWDIIGLSKGDARSNQDILAAP